jgi:hypothetical protein
MHRADRTKGLAILPKNFTAGKSIHRFLTTSSGNEKNVSVVAIHVSVFLLICVRKTTAAPAGSPARVPALEGSIAKSDAGQSLGVQQ